MRFSAARRLPVRTSTPGASLHGWSRADLLVERHGGQVAAVLLPHWPLRTRRLTWQEVQPALLAALDGQRAARRKPWERLAESLRQLGTRVPGIGSGLAAFWSRTAGAEGGSGGRAGRRHSPPDTPSGDHEPSAHKASPSSRRSASR